ncbi:MAG: ATP-binding cassette domain-containing protein [Phycisphaeraceae bacterium]
MIQADQLVKWFGPTRAVGGLTFSIEKGQVVGFLGPNGAGKSTTLRILTGYLPPTSGTASINGHDVLKASEAARRSIGYLPESTPLYPEMRVEEYLDYRGKLLDMPRRDRVRRIGEVCDRCGLSHIRRRLIGQLSKGNRQRVGLAQALIHEPAVLFLDEPTAGLDPNQIKHFRELLAELRQKHTILLSSHILHEIEKTVDRVLIIKDGELAADGTTDQLCAKVQGGPRIVLDLEAHVDEVGLKLRQVPGVQDLDVTPHDGWCRVEVVAKHQRDGLEDTLKQAAQTNSWKVRDITHRKPNLEDYYLQLFRDSNHPPQRVSA